MKNKRKIKAAVLERIVTTLEETQRDKNAWSDLEDIFDLDWEEAKKIVDETFEKLHVISGDKLK